MLGPAKPLQKSRSKRASFIKKIIGLWEYHGVFFCGGNMSFILKLWCYNGEARAPQYIGSLV